MSNPPDRPLEIAIRRRTLLSSIAAAPLGVAALGQTTPAAVAAISIDPRVDWQVVDGGGWGLIQDLGGGTTGPVNPKYYVLANYARHIRPGMRIIDGGNGNTIAAYDAPTRKLTIVATNYGPPGT